MEEGWEIITCFINETSDGNMVEIFFALHKCDKVSHGHNKAFFMKVADWCYFK